MAFNFGGTFGAAAPQPASATGSFSVGPSAVSGGDSSTAPLPSASVTVPTYDELLPGRSIWFKIDHLIRTLSSTAESHVGILAGQEFLELLRKANAPLSQNLLLKSTPQKHSVLDRTTPDHALRQQLSQSLLVRLSLEDVNGTITLQEARLTPTMWQDICAIADDLHISEVVAMSLYQQALTSDVPIQSSLVRSIFKDHKVAMDVTSTAWMARELYFAQSPLILQAVLALWQHRLREDSAKTSSSRPVTEATDFLLESEDWIAHLIQLVRKYSETIHALLLERSSSESRRAPLGLPSSAPSEDASHLWRHEVLLQTCFRERLLAVECIFFITYQLQLKAAEVVALIHLVRDLSNDCLILNPYTDVPDPWELVSSDASLQFGAPWMAPLPSQQQEKGALAWERELVATAWKTGQPQLLQSVSVLVAAVLSALGDRTLFMDRSTHMPNAIGVGNCLFPPGSTSIDKCDILHAALSRESAASWKRPDVLGLIMASYAMLLRSSPMALSSPRTNSTGVDIRKSFRDCIEASCELKSFSFARFCWIPALRVSAHVSNDYSPMSSALAMCDVTEFLLSVVAEFASHFLDILAVCGDQPISRAKWELDAEETLKLRRAHQEQQQSFRGQFPTWRDAAANVGNNEIPSEVDLLARPDCVDDIVAFATSVGSIGSNYALQFWSQESTINQEIEYEKSTKLVPSQALTWLDRQQRDDDSLRPLYLSFLAVLALAKNPCDSSNGGSGADVVHSIISNEDNVDGSGWSTLLNVLRWYMRQLNPDFANIQKPASSTVMGGGSTAYYYSDSDDREYESGFRSERSRSGDAASPSVMRELGEKNELIILSHLALITNVALSSAAARFAIVMMSLPIIEADGESVGQESALMILFTLAVMPLSADIRGSVFRTIAALISVRDSNMDETVEMQKAAFNAWELLESCHFVPINALAQYPSLQDGSVHFPKMLFPPSSSVVASRRTEPCWISSDPRYGIIYEMEFIESHHGRYPSTEGFLLLLKSLFAVGGFPSALGSNLRIRTGCTPYVEYIIDFILPRATGRFEHYAPLSFRSIQEKNRFVAIALEAVETVLVQYHVPCTTIAIEPGDSLADCLFHASREEAAQVLDQSIIASAVVRPHGDDVSALVGDFVNASTGVLGHGLPQGALSDNESFSPLPSRTSSSFPLSKSPGFAVLATLLSPSRASLFQAIISPLVDRRNRSTPWPDFPMLSLAFALYASTPPTFTSAKDGAKRLWTHSGRQSLLLSLLPRSYLDEETLFDERSILSALRILCAAVAREDLFLKRIQASKAEQSAYVPELRFSGKSRLPISIDLHLSHLSTILSTSDIETGIASSIIDLIGFISSNERNESAISAMAFSFYRYLERTLPRVHVFELLCHDNPRRVYGAISDAFNVRFLAALARPPKEPHMIVLRSILDRLLLDLRSCSFASNLVNVMFGPSPDSSSHCQKSLETILKVIERIEFVCGRDSAEVATMFYELLYRLVASASKNVEQDRDMALWVAERLRTTDFWKTHILRLCSAIPLRQQYSTIVASRYNVVHSISWLLKGISCELHILSGFPSTGQAATASPNCYKRLSLALFTDNGLIAHAIRVLPIERPILTAGIVSTPSDEKAVIGAKVGLAGSPEVVEGYSTVSYEKLKVYLNRMALSFEDNGLRAWVDHWNASVQMDCSSAHLSDAIRIVTLTFLACSKDSPFDVPPGLGPGITILTQMLSCMDVHGLTRSNNASIDDIFFTTACRNLALAACEVSISDYSRGLCQNDLEFASLIGLFLRLIAASPRQSRTVAEQTRRKDRIAALAAALMSVLIELPDQVSIEADRVCLFDSATVLADLATRGDIPETRPFSPSTETVVLRGCCGLLFEKLERTQSSTDGFSICRAVLVHAGDGKNDDSPMQGIINSISSLDDNIAVFVQKLIFVSPQVGSLMIASGILEALQKASDNYFKEEEKFLTFHANSQKLEDVFIQPPSFLRGHFDIMNALMTTQLSPKLSGYLVSTVISISCKYKVMFERLIRHFPVHGDTMYAMLRCLIQGKVLFDEAKYMPSDSSEQSVVLGDDSVDLKALAGSISKLIFHLAEHPLPSHMLAAIPSRLNVSLTTSGIVLSEGVAKSWWAAYEAKSSDVSSFCEIAVLGMDLLRYGVFLIRQTRILATLDEFTLSRSLFRCSDAAQRIDSAIRSSQEQVHMRQSSHSEVEQLKVLRSKLVDAVDDLLILIVLRVRENRLARLDNSSLTLRCQALKFALDHIDFDALRFGRNNLHGQDENQDQLTSVLVRKLRFELDQIL